MKSMSMISAALILLSACAPIQSNGAVTPAAPAAATSNGPVIPNPYSPQPGDDALTIGTVIVSTADLLLLASSPVKVSVVIHGNLPSPCHKLRALIEGPSSENKISLKLYSVVDPNATCAQVLQSFEVNIPLGSFPPGHYSVWVNGEQFGVFDA
jgi:hypothetical protein